MDGKKERRKEGKRERGQVFVEFLELIAEDSRWVNESYCLMNKLEIPLNVIYFLRLNTNTQLRSKTQKTSNV